MKRMNRQHVNLALVALLAVSICYHLLNVAAEVSLASGPQEGTGVAEVSGGQDQGAQRAMRHIVLFKFKEGTTPAKVQEIEQAFAALPEKIDTIIDFEFGTDVSIEGKSKGFTHCFLVTFRDEAGRAIYLPHPAHEAFVKLVVPHIEDVLVFDYWTTIAD